MQEKSYKQIVILSGKGGTGKTTISAAFASLIKNKVVIDCDVDAANLHLVLEPEILNSYDFIGGKKAFIEQDKCRECGLCKSVCRFDAIENHTVNRLSCEGCGFCFRACPMEAISFHPVISGSYYECELSDKSKFYYARLLPGEGNSGKLVSQLKRIALNRATPEIEWVIVDGPPGIGCPVNASIASSDFVVIVTEPTLSGIHDLKRLAKLLDSFKLKAGIVINKYDLNEEVTSQISEFAKNENIPVIGLLPFNKIFVEALINGKNIVDINTNIRNEILSIWEKLKSLINKSLN